MDQAQANPPCAAAAGRRSFAPAVLAAIIALGLGIRLTGLVWGQGYTTFGHWDTVEAYSVAVDYSQGEPKAQYLGQPNFNHQAKLPGPLWTMFCLAGLRLWGSFEGVMVAILLLNTAAIYLTYLLAKRTLGEQSALWAALLAATLPQAVHYSVAVYNPNVMPCLGGLLFLALWQCVQREGSRCIFWVALLLLMMPQFHMSGLMLLPAVAIILLLCPVRLNIRWLLGGVLAGACLYAPYVRGELAHGWQNTSGMTAASGHYSWGTVKALISPVNLLLTWVPQWFHSFAEYLELGRACFGWLGLLFILNLLSAVVAICLATGAFRQVRQAMRGFWHSPRQAFKKSPGILFLAILVVVPLLSALPKGRPFHARYALVLFPPLLALVGNAAAGWLASPRVSRVFLPALLLAVGINTWFMPAMYRYQGLRMEHGDVFIPSLRQLEKVYQHLKAHAGSQRGVRVQDTAYLMSFLPLQDKPHLDAQVIRIYVAIREKELGSASSPVTYTLCRADQVKPDDPAIAFLGNGIALKAGPQPNGVK